MQRLALIIFGALLIVLFVGFALAQGIGRESVPEGDVAIVEDGPEGANTVSETELKIGIVQQALQGGLKKAPKAGSDKYEELRSAALSELLDFIWIRGQAEELGLTATKKELEDELAAIKEQNFPAPGSYEKFLKTSKLSQADVDKRVELQVLSGQITEAVNANAGTPSDDEVKDFYDAAKETQFTTPQSRDVRVIVNKDKAKVEAAKAALEQDDSPASWKKVAQQYSSDPTTKTNGGLQEGLTEELLATAGPLKGAIFSSATNELVGPISYQGNYTVLQVVKLQPAKVQTLAEARGQIVTQLQQQAQEDFFEGFVGKYQAKWESRTVCASGFEVERCSNYKGNGHPSTANPACYEANPKTPATECPAPVTPISPAMPGSVTLLQPKGDRRPQRPIPVDAAKAGANEQLPEGIQEAPGE